MPTISGYPTGIIECAALLPCPPLSRLTLLACSPQNPYSLEYQGVYQTKDSGCGGYGCSLQTWYISVALKDSDGKETEVSLKCCLCRALRSWNYLAERLAAPVDRNSWPSTCPLPALAQTVAISRPT